MDEPAPGIPVGRILGVPVYLTRAWFLIVAVIVATFAPQIASARPDLGGLAYLLALVYALALMGSVLLHEVSHAAAARACGSTPHRIVLDLFGGHTAFSEDDTRPSTRFLVAAAGPATNLALAGALWFVVHAGDPYSIVIRLLWGVMWTNGFVGLFNLLPGLPLDGGAMLEAVVWAVTGRRSTGTRVAACLGLAATVGVVLYAFRGLFMGVSPGLATVVWSLLIASMLGRASWEALQLAALRRRAERLDLRRLTDPATVVDPRTPISALHAAGPVVVVDPATGAPVAMVDPEALHQAVAAGRSDAAVMAVSRGLTWREVVTEGTDPFLVVVRFSNEPIPTMVATEHGRVVGVLQRDRVSAAF